MIQYYIPFFPKTKDDAERFISKFSKSFTKEDYEDLRDIFLEYNGKNTNNTRIHTFLLNQRWYEKDNQIQIPDEVFEVIENRTR